MITAEDIYCTLEQMGDERQARNLSRFFKTGKGDYGEGDRFLGLKCPQTRMVVREARLDVPFEEIEKLLYSEWHEVRFAGFMLLVEEMKAALPRKRDPQTLHAERRKAVVDFYLRHARQANNWDLVDMTCTKIVGEWLLYPQADGTMPDHGILDRLAASDNLWEQRIGMVTTWRLTRAGQTDDTFRLATKLLHHPHDLMHKAVGWMLREAGKVDKDLLLDYLEEHYREMSRTTLRYAIERLPEPERQYWLKRQ